MAPAFGPRRVIVFAALALAASVSACSMGGPRLSNQNAPPVSTSAPSAAQAAGGAYNVVAGDTIYVVARRFGVTVRALIDANGLQAPFQLNPGQVLRLPMGGDYVVVKGDTLVKVARKTGVEFATIARMNNLSPPYVIHIGQRLLLPTGANVQAGVSDGVAGDMTVIQSPNAAQPGAVVSAPVETMRVETLSAPPPQPARETTTFGAAMHESPVTTGATDSTYRPLAQRDAAAQDNAKPTVPSQSTSQSPPPLAPAAKAAVLESVPASMPRPTDTPRVQSAAATPARPPAAGMTPAFIWPVHGPVLSPFGSIAKGQHNDGVNIAVPKGTPVLAAADGDVAYAGNELRGFGNLLLIKHTGTDYVTAYAHNEKLLVHRGEHVHKGQKIALSGDSGGVTQPQLHFELRQGVRPIDPQTILPPELSPAVVPSAQQDPG